MKNVVKHIIASNAGSLTFLLLMNLEDLFDILGIIERSEMKYSPHVAISDIFLTIVFFILILTLQRSLVNPIFYYLKKANNYNNRTILIVAICLRLTLGIVFGLTLGEPQQGTKGILIATGIGIGIFSTQYLINFLTNLGIERKIEKR